MNDGCCVVCSFKGEYVYMNWKFPPETWHEANLSDDKLVYRLGWHVECAAELGAIHMSVTCPLRDRRMGALDFDGADAQSCMML